MTDKPNDTKLLINAEEHEVKHEQFEMNRDGSLVATVLVSFSSAMLRDIKDEEERREALAALVADDVRKRLKALLERAPV